MHSGTQTDFMILHITNDLMMSSTVRSHARTHAQEITFANSMADANRLLASDDAFQVCFVDLQMPGLDLADVAKQVAARELRTIVYAQHVRTELLASAKEYEFAEVMSRGQFNKSVGSLVDLS